MKNKQVIFIRADGNEQIATGHIMRCLSIAKEFVKRNISILFLVSDSDSERFLKSKLPPLSDSYSIKCLHTDLKQPDQEISAVTALIKDYMPLFLLVDSYFVTESYLSALQALVNVVYLDDRMAFDYPVHTIINYDLEVNSAFYSNAVQILTGGKFTPLREDFNDSSYTPKEKATHILLSTGGADSYRLAPKLLQQFLTGKEWNSYIFHTVIGSFSTQKEQLTMLSQDHPNLILEENVTDMKALMMQCDLAITAGGTTLYELCALGIPSVGYALNENQHLCIQAFANSGLIQYAGLLNQENELIPSIIRETSYLVSHTDLRKNMSLRMRNTIDGNGASRITDALLNIKF